MEPSHCVRLINISLVESRNNDENILISFTWLLLFHTQIQQFLQHNYTLGLIKNVFFNIVGCPIFTTPPIVVYIWWSSYRQSVCYQLCWSKQTVLMWDMFISGLLMPVPRKWLDSRRLLRMKIHTGESREKLRRHRTLLGKSSKRVLQTQEKQMLLKKIPK